VNHPQESGPPATANLLRQFLKFGFVGCIGFVVDTSVLYAAIGLAGLGPYLSRVLSYLSAATATWYLNRIITFADRRSDKPGREWLRFLLVNASGGTVNYLTYVTYLRMTSATGIHPMIGVALGSCAGLVVNFLLSRRLVFSGSRTVRGPTHVG
jgi:putative flippase GtrA